MTRGPQLWTAASVAGRSEAAAYAGPLPEPAADPADGRDRSPGRSLLAAGRVAIQLAVAVATVLFLALALLPLAQHRAMIVTSGSMEPLLSAGDVAIIHTLPLTDLRPGDVITFQAYGTDRLTTHRIVRPVELDSGLHFQTQGDANAAPDPDLAPAGGVIGRYVTGVPEAGRLLLLIAQPHGRLLLVGLPAAATLAGELRYLLARRRSLGAEPTPAWGVAAGLAVLGVATAAGVLLTTGTILTDADTVGGNSFSTSSAFPA